MDYFNSVISTPEYRKDPKAAAQALIDERGGEEVFICDEDPTLDFIRVTWGVKLTEVEIPYVPAPRLLPGYFPWVPYE